ncbi:MAG: glycogen/starch/alpha-glucan phosphorylase [Marinisporobacter sp.]|nr:glycogen/starch/alpha-glucan phosphorylase [Marinisporobacter sp.]
MSEKNIQYEKEKSRIKDSVEGKIKRYFRKNLEDATMRQIYHACAMTVRDEIMEKWTKANEFVTDKEYKKVYYLSVEYLIGRSLENNISNMFEENLYKDALSELGIDLEKVIEVEPDAGLGNGGLGRLAACYLDSMTSLGLPCTAYGIRYEYGLFKQKIVDGYQIELPDPWLEYGNVWEVHDPEDQQEVRFGGSIKEVWENGKLKIMHQGYNSVMAVPYMIPITGYNSKLVNTLRLWSARSPKNMDMSHFGRGDYIKAVEEKELAEVISKVLYPEDYHYEGKALRLKQHYFFVSATMQHIVKKHKENSDIHTLAEKIAVHINDTHPALAIPELMRILLDKEQLEWDEAWIITKKVFAYTNHTIMPEALEKWSGAMLKQLIPRIYMIIHEINERYCKGLWEYYPEQLDKISDMAIISGDQVRMANLCIAASHKVNGVSALHTNILKEKVFKDFYKINPSQFVNVTNGVTQRRWLLSSNKDLAKLITNTIGEDWILQGNELKKLESYKEDRSFREAFFKIKKKNKESLANYIMDTTGIKVSTDSIFDVQIKRMHEYKRQLMNVLHIIYLYNKMIKDSNFDMVPRTFIFGAKVSPGYKRAKRVIKLIHSVAQMVNNDIRVKNRMKVVFLEDYKVSVAEKIIPATDISEQISTASKEASGTGNMKFMLNGAITVGTLDGANVEIKELVGNDNIYIFGLTADEVLKYYKYGTYHPRELLEHNYEMKKAVKALVDGTFQPDGGKLFEELYNSLLFGEGDMADKYFVLKDFEPYCNIQAVVNKDYQDQEGWLRKAIVNVANAGYFSSDRSVSEYNEKIWGLEKVEI